MLYIVNMLDEQPKDSQIYLKEHDKNVEKPII